VVMPAVDGHDVTNEGNGTEYTGLDFESRITGIFLNKEKRSFYALLLQSIKTF
jgi:hypothetical protein